MFKRCLVFSVVWVFLIFLAALSEKTFAGKAGSVSFSVNQKFFSNALLKNVNGSSAWVALGLSLDAGLPELYGIQPLIGGSFISNSTGDASRRFEYQLYSGRLGARFRFWSREFFILSPYLEAFGQADYLRGRYVTTGEVKEKLLQGLDMSFVGGGGFFVSFLYDQQRKNDLDLEWNVSDFGALFAFHYSKGGFVKNGSVFSTVDSVDFWDFGLGLLVDW
jgi:hypothetical protein